MTVLILVFFRRLIVYTSASLGMLCGSYVIRRCYSVNLTRKGRNCSHTLNQGLFETRYTNEQFTRLGFVAVK